jgi:hypothetical protein
MQPPGSWLNLASVYPVSSSIRQLPIWSRTAQVSSTRLLSMTQMVYFQQGYAAYILKSILKIWYIIVASQRGGKERGPR